MKYYEYENTYSNDFKKYKKLCFEKNQKKVKKNHDYYRSHSTKRKIEKAQADEERRVLNEHQHWRK